MVVVYIIIGVIIGAVATALYYNNRYILKDKVSDLNDELKDKNW